VGVACFFACAWIEFGTEICQTIVKNKAVETKTATIRAAFLTPICTKSFFLLELRPRLTEGAYSAPPDPLAVFRGPTSLIKGGKGGEVEEKGWRRGEEEKRRGGEGRGE